MPRSPLYVWLPALSGVVAVLLGPAVASPTENLHLSADARREDLRFFARELPARHANAFHFTSRDSFDAAIRALDAQLDGLDSDAIWVRLDAIANRVGDAHTYVQFPADQARLDLLVGSFEGELRVAAVPAGQESLLGARITAVEDVPIERVRSMIRSLTPQDENESLSEAYVAQYITIGLVLHGLGVTGARDSARFTLAGEDGHTYAHEAHALSPAQFDAMAWVRPFRDTPLARQRPDQSFWWQDLPASHTVYCNVRRIRGLAGPSRALIEHLRSTGADRFVLDLRQNGGGDYHEGENHLVRALRDLPAINRKGHLFILVGPLTFSAAMANAAQFRAQTAAILVGRTIGEKPNEYAEPREMTLPRSGLVVRYSTRYYEFAPGGENAVRPDHEVTTSWAEYAAGRDPALEWALQAGAE